MGGGTEVKRLHHTSREAADANIPSPFLNLFELITIFENHDLDEKDLVVLFGGHNLGYAQCAFFQGTNLQFLQHRPHLCKTTSTNLPYKW